MSHTPSDGDNNPPPSAPWTPVVGDEGRALLGRLTLSHTSKTRVIDESLGILHHCVSPAAPPQHETGLVIGHVQSGKTLSFTTVAAIARDNGYRLVIVISGLTTNLFNQSRDRLNRDLLTQSDRHRWLSLDNPRNQTNVRDSIEIALGSEHRCVLITVMKNGSHLDNLLRLLGRLSLHQVPTLIIDDEADQASMNNEVRRGTASATYRRLVALKRLLPHHTYLQYTATPQAPLLINLIDVLSPRFVQVLTPGESYTGGGTFFRDGSDLIRRIKADEVPSRNNSIEYPPASLIEALRLFFLGVAFGLATGHDLPSDDATDLANRSMMIHPSMETSPHANYQEWIRSIKRTWRRILDPERTSLSDQNYLDFIEDIRCSYEDLHATVPSLLPLENLLPYLERAINDTLVTEVNTRQGRTPAVPWNQHYAHILVGGETLSRGFTVNGLTVTYMPRGLGTGQADTIEQRARWFGYKEAYLGLCRVWLPVEAENAYRHYVEHEQNMRDALQAFASTNRPLTEWKRAFFLAPELRPTRHSVLDTELVRGNYANRWFKSTRPHDSDEAVVWNRALHASLISHYEDRFEADEGDVRRTEDQKHLIAQGINLVNVYRNFLSIISVSSPVDSSRYTGLLLQLAHYVEEHPDEPCTLIQMKSGGIRERSVQANGSITELFQGYDPQGSSIRDRIYPGDDKIRDTDTVTIQLHRLDILDRPGGNLVADDVLALAVWLPRRFSVDWISQHQDPANVALD